MATEKLGRDVQHERRAELRVLQHRCDERIVDQQSDVPGTLGEPCEVDQLATVGLNTRP